MARLYHPDVHRGEENKRVAEEQFKQIATAYEILRDDGSRSDYDYMLDNPDEYYSHYYRYYRRRVTPKVDVRLVIVVAITVISVVQYFTAYQRWDTAIKHFVTVPKYRNKAIEMIQQESKEKTEGKKTAKSKLSKTEQKDELEKQIRRIVEQKMDIQGGYAKPEIYDILWIQLVFSPYYIARYVVWYCSWIWNFTILRKPYGREEKLYIIRKYMKLGQNQFNLFDEETKENYLEMELWIRENFEEWKFEEEEEQKKQMADNPRYKAYRRYMKNHGPGRMTFED